MDFYGHDGALAVRTAGFGKTRSTIALFILLARMLDVPLRVLLVMPTILFDTWVTEIKMVAPTCSVTVYDATVCLRNGKRAVQQYTAMQRAAENSNFFIVGMCSLRTELRKHESGTTVRPSVLWGNCITPWTLCAIDEVHILRNASAKLFQAAKQMRGRVINDSAKLVALTATPFINRASDVYNALSLVAGVDESLHGEAAASWLQTKYLNRDSDVIDVGVLVTFRVVSAQMLPAEMLLYREAQQRYVEQYESDVTKRGRHARLHGELMRLRAMLECFELPDNECGSKLQQIMEEVHVAPSVDRIVIFHIYKHTSRCLYERLSDTRPVFVLNGDIPESKRCETLRKWARTPGGILLAQLFITGCGLNLQCAAHVFFALRWYNSAMEMQAIARVLRYGQIQPVQVVFFIHENVYIEGEWLQTLHAAKREAEQQLLGNVTDMFSDNSSDPENVAALNENSLQLLHSKFCEHL